MQKVVIRIEREALGGVLRARVETELENFYNLAAAQLKTEASQLLRPVLRDGAKRLLRSNDKLRRNKRLKILAHGL